MDPKSLDNQGEEVENPQLIDLHKVPLMLNPEIEERWIMWLGISNKKVEAFAEGKLFITGL